VRAGGYVNNISHPRHSTVKTAAVKRMKHVVKDSVVLMTKLAQLIV
jgi:hypothetical protein